MAYYPYQNYFQPQDQLAQLRQPYQTPQYQQQYQQQYQPVEQSGVIWVQGEEGAKAYLVARGSSVLLMDSENPVFYIKSCDHSGMPSLRSFDYTERTAQRPQVPQMAQAQEFVTWDRFKALEARIDALTAPVQMPVAATTHEEVMING